MNSQKATLTVNRRAGRRTGTDAPEVRCPLERNASFSSYVAHSLLCVYTCLPAAGIAEHDQSRRATLQSRPLICSCLGVRNWTPLPCACAMPGSPAAHSLCNVTSGRAGSHCAERAQQPHQCCCSDWAGAVTRTITGDSFIVHRKCTPCTAMFGSEWCWCPWPPNRMSRSERQCHGCTLVLTR
jgi:hypothetical protein